MSDPGERAPVGCAAYQVHPQDNVATLLDDADAGPVRVIHAAGDPTIVLLQPIAAGHKVALHNLADGEAVVKFGIAIGDARGPIRRGEWVHVHNCSSRVDERSAAVDAVSGSMTDTPYR